MDEGWRKQTALRCLETKPGKILDLCCGTGDLGLWLARLAGNETRVFGLDYSEPMLNLALHKLAKYELNKAVVLIIGDVSMLPFTSGYFDSIGISFAFRNLTFKNPMTDKYLAEIMRVLKPGGRFVIVESSQPPNIFVRKLDHLYIHKFVRHLGVLISKNRAAYDYLAESASRFYNAPELASLLAKAGFSQITFKRLFFGACAIHVAIK